MAKVAIIFCFRKTKTSALSRKSVAIVSQSNKGHPDNARVAFLILIMHLKSILVGRNQFVAFTVDVDDFDGVILLQVLAQLGDIHVHAAGVEIVVINPNGF